MKKITFLLAMMLVTFTACHNEDFEEISLESKREKISYEVTPEEAVSRLGMFLSNNGTRASLNDVTIKTLMKSDFVPTTRSSDAEDAPAVYLIDIPDGGCAIMGADKRLEPVYAIMDETKLSPEDLTTAATRTESADEEDIQTFVTGLINDAVEADIKGIPIIKDTTELIPNPYPHEEIWDETTMLKQIAPILNTKWHQQQSPFYNNFPRDHLNRHEAAGCGTIALAQLIYHHRRPNNINGIIFDWNLIRQYAYGYELTPTQSAKVEIANFVYITALAVNADWSREAYGTTTSLSDIANLMSQSGYFHVGVSDYNYNAIDYMLDDELPVIVRGADSSDVNGSRHIWLIDGCKNYKIDHWIRLYKNPPIMIDELPYEEHITSTDTYNLFHCNYGYGGYYDGYYPSGLFDMRDQLPEDRIDTSVGDIAGNNLTCLDTGLYMIPYSLNY